MPPVAVPIPHSPVPIFPLPGLFLFPHQVLPLHVFEPRYRQLVEDLLDGPGRFVIGTVHSGETETPTHAPALLPVAGLGELVRHEKLPDGRYRIWTLGLARVRITEVASDRLYRQVRCAPFVEIAAADAEAGELALALHAATTARLEHKLPLPASTPPALLADLLVQTLGAPPEMLERFYAEPSVSARARLVLQAAERAAPGQDPE